MISLLVFFVFFFFFQAEDGIRYHCVTGVQTCALPIFVIIIMKGTLKILPPALRTGATERLQTVVPGLRRTRMVLIARLSWHHCFVPIKLLILPAHRRPALESALPVKRSSFSR